MKLKKINKKWIFIILLCIALIPTNALAASSFSKSDTISMCGWDNMPAIMPKLTSALYVILKVFVPIILIILGIVDFMNATMAPDVDKMKKHQKKFITRLIAAVFIFFIAAIVQMVFRKLDTADKQTFFTCMDCILSNKNCEISGGSGGTSGGTSCSSRSESDCTATMDKNGHKCVLVKTAYSSKPVCKMACGEYTSTGSCASQDGRCKWSGDTSTGKCVENPNYSPSKAISKGTNGGYKDTGGTTGDTTGNTTGDTTGNTTGSTSQNNNSFSNTKCSDCSSISDSATYSKCIQNCQKTDQIGNTSSNNNQFKNTKCSACSSVSDPAGRSVCLNNCISDSSTTSKKEGGGGSSGGTTTTNTSKTTTQVTCIGLPEYECKNHTDKCSWSTALKKCGNLTSSTSTIVCTNLTRENCSSHTICVYNSSTGKCSYKSMSSDCTSLNETDCKDNILTCSWKNNKCDFKYMSSN